MNLVDENGDIIVQANYEFSDQIKFYNEQDNFKQVSICQNQKYFATYRKLSSHIYFWRKINKLKSLLIKKCRRIESVIIQNSLIVVMLDGDLYIYNNKNKLINKSQKLNIFHENISFTFHKKIIFQKNYRVLTYDFVKKNYIFYDCCSISNTYGYCPINDVILIPSADQNTNYIRVWNVPQCKMINQVEIMPLRLCQIKMAKSGKYFIIKEYRDSVVYIYEYGNTITLFKKLYQFYPCQIIEWILDDKYLLNYSFTQFEICKIDSDQLLNCKIQKNDGTEISNRYDIQDKQHKKQLYLYKKIQRPLVHYYSIVL